MFSYKIKDKSQIDNSTRVIVKVNLKYQIEQEIIKGIKQAYTHINSWQEKTINETRKKNFLLHEVFNEKRTKEVVGSITFGKFFSGFSKYLNRLNNPKSRKPIDPVGMEIAMLLFCLKRISFLQGIRFYFTNSFHTWRQKSNQLSIKKLLMKEIFLAIECMGYDIPAPENITIFKAPKKATIINFFPPKDAFETKPFNGILGPKHIILNASFAALLLGLTNEIHSFCLKQLEKRKIVKQAKENSWVKRIKGKDLSKFLMVQTNTPSISL